MKKSNVARRFGARGALPPSPRAVRRRLPPLQSQMATASTPCFKSGPTTPQRKRTPQSATARPEAASTANAFIRPICVCLLKRQVSRAVAFIRRGTRPLRSDGRRAACGRPLGLVFFCRGCSVVGDHKRGGERGVRQGSAARSYVCWRGSIRIALNIIFESLAARGSHRRRRISLFSTRAGCPLTSRRQACSTLFRIRINDTDKALIAVLSAKE